MPSKDVLCGACTDFRRVLKTIPSKDTAKTECPPNAGELGRASWTLLHSMAAYYPLAPAQDDRDAAAGLITGVARLYPCSHCALHFQLQIGKYPPALDSNVALSDWFCRMHNSVNRLQGKPEFDCSKVFERWKKGNTDCDVAE